jgi:hypothetical protein
MIQNYTKKLFKKCIYLILLSKNSQHNTIYYFTLHENTKDKYFILDFGKFI